MWPRKCKMELKSPKGRGIRVKESKAKGLGSRSVIAEGQLEGKDQESVGGVGTSQEYQVSEY